MRVLVTRHQTAADRLVMDLRERGFNPVVEPLLEIVDTGASVSLSGVQAVLATSTNGVAALSRLMTAKNMPRDVKLLAVGDVTAQAARDAGFSDVESAGGDSNGLADLACARCDPGAGRLLHVAGGHVAGNMVEVLERSGFTVERAVLYEARTPASLGEEAAGLIAAGKIDAVLFYSPRTAETFARLVHKAGLIDACAAMDAVCLSAAVAEMAKTILWRRVRVAEGPVGAAMLSALEAIRVETLTVDDGVDEQ